MLLSNIHSPEDLKKIPKKDLSKLADEVRKKIIEVVGKNGGHLASNLGVVELTIALHRVFSSPDDAIIFDVSHQCYAHKMFTGRYEQFQTIRKYGGISGFTRKTESEHDFFDNGHSSTSISQGLGLLTSWELTGKKGKVVAVIGDGALTGGMALEAMNHAGQLGKNLIVVLNDNQMSISQNTGSISKYLSRLTMSNFYQSIRHKIDSLVSKIPNSNRHLGKFIYRCKRAIKGLFLSNNFFTDLGFEYVGPLDGHNIKEMEDVFNDVKNLKGPVVVHIVTKKGKGYSPAENDPASFHGIGPFLISDGKVEKFDLMSFTESFSRTLVEIALKNTKIAAITAAMSKGTGLDSFARHYPQRFFDVGIAEEHAVTFAAGLATGGMIPVVAIYSTFIQRAIDQIIHDVALPKLPVVFCFDRAGIVPGDGETHQGMFDIALLRCVPNLTLLSPATSLDMKLCLDWAIKAEKPVALRYPKSACPTELKAFENPVKEGQGIFIKSEEFAPALSVKFEDEIQEPKNKAKSVLFVTTGGMLAEVIQACRNLMIEGIEADIYSLRFIKPLDFEHLYSYAKDRNAVVFVEDAVITGGIAEELQRFFFEKGFFKTCVCAIPQKFIVQGNRNQICEDVKLDPRSLAQKAYEMVGEK
ncbi:1-deoxy-D-xylulose-5-phosphate synthase [Treponema pectinovorum]|uniref:1-deoxy-D-xylulose-5-phosphate synthase n=1 Tax=Treponema pectinovorum TaxID=164 RepID=UPI0011F3D224|nr:1-deoxy-D-xylulose-5-phosphate synthase [Treponema pectinovorum]